MECAALISFESPLDNGFKNDFTWYVYRDDVILGDSCDQVTVRDVLNVRSSPVITANIITSLKPQTSLRLVGQTKETSDGYKWQQISEPDFGWIAASHNGTPNISDSPCPMPAIG